MSDDKLVEEQARIKSTLDDGRYFLTSWDHESTVPTTSVKALLFGHLVKRAMLLVEHYESDLYHDAMWLDKFLVDSLPFTFYFACREHGTSIGTDCEAVSTGNDLLWKVVVSHDGGAWYAEFTSGGCEEMGND